MAQTFLSDIKLGDNIFIRLGDATNGDLQVYHDGNHSYIQDAGTGELRLAANVFRVLNANASETMIYAEQDGKVQLRFNEQTRFETTNTGVDVTGNLDVSGSGTFGGMVTVNGGGIDIDNDDDIRLRFDNASTFKAGLQVVTTIGDMIANSAVNDFAIRSQTNMLFATGGNTERMRIDSSGKIGIGKTPSTWAFDVDTGLIYIASFDGANNTGVVINSNNATAAQIMGYSNSASTYNDLDIRANATAGSGVYVDGSASTVGIGTTTPLQKLTVNGATFITGALTSPGSAGSYTYNGTAVDYHSDGARYWSWGNATTRGTFSFIQLENDGQNQQTALSINSSGAATFAGNVGIKESSIDANLHITDTNPNIKFERSGQGKWAFGIPNNQTYLAFDETSDDLSTPTMVLTKTTKFVGIGNSDPSQRLHLGDGTDALRGIMAIEGAGGQHLIFSEASDYGSGANAFALRPAAGTKFLIQEDGASTVAFSVNTNGNVGVGVGAAYKELEIIGDLQLDAADANIWIKSGAVGTNGFINWTFNTNDTVFNKVGIDYDTRATTGFHIDAGYPITIDGTTFINFALSGINQGSWNSTGLGIGTGSSIDERLHVQGSVNNDDVAIKIENTFDDDGASSAPASALLFAAASNNGYIRLTGSPSDNAAQHKFEIGSTASDSFITFKPSGGIALTLDSSQNAKFEGSITMNSGANFFSDSIFQFLNTGSGAQYGKFRGIQVSTSYSGTPPSQGILFGTDTNLYRDSANVLKTDDSLVVDGDLTVNGTTTTINTTTVEVEDNILQLNTTQGSPDTATAATSGISIYRGDGVTQASFIFDDADDTWDLTNNLNVAGNVTVNTVTSGDINISKTDPTITLFDNSGANTDPHGRIVFKETANSENFDINYNGTDDRLEFRGRIGNNDNTDLVYINRDLSNALQVVGVLNVGTFTSTGTSNLNIISEAEHDTKLGFFEDNLNHGFSLNYDGGDNDFIIKRHDSSAGGTPVLTLFRENNHVKFEGNIAIGGLDVDSAKALRIKSQSTSAQSSAIEVIQNGTGTNPIIRMGEKSTDGARLHMFDGGTEKIAFYTDGTNNHISAGNLGINDVSPSKGKLQIDQESNTLSSIQLVNTAQASSNFASYPISIFFGDEQKGSSARHQASINAVREAWSDSPAALTFKTSATVNGATEKMRITSAGLVGIGTDSPDESLHIKNNDGANIILNSDTNTNDSGIYMSEGADATPTQNGAYVYYDASANEFKIATGGSSLTDRLTIARDTGNATFAGDITLDDNSGASPSLFFKNEDNNFWRIFCGSSLDLTFRVGTVTKFDIDSSGNGTFAGEGTFGGGIVNVNGTTTSALALNASTHDTNTANVATLSFSYAHSAGVGVGHIKLTEDANNSFGADMTFGVPHNNGSGGSTTRTALTLDGGTLNAAFVGNVSVNTTSAPVGNLQVVGDAGSAGRIYISDVDEGTTTGKSALAMKSGIHAYYYNRDSGNLYLGTNDDPNKLIINDSEAIFAGKISVAGTSEVGSSNGKVLHGSKSVNIGENTFTTVLTVSLANHTSCYVKIFGTGDWSSHSAVTYLGEFFLQNGANGYNEPGMIIREVDNTKTDAIVAKIVDPTGNTNPKNFEIQLKADDTVAAVGPTIKLTYEVMGVFGIVS